VKPLLSRDADGNATVELIVSMLAVAPFLVGIPLLGKQLDVKHKAYDSARYSVWERTVWSSAGAANRKSDTDISLESRDRLLGDPRSGIIPIDRVRELGLSENPLWRDAEARRIVSHGSGATGFDLELAERPSPVDVGRWIAPGVAYGEGSAGRIGEALQLHHLGLNRHGLASASASIAVRPILARAFGESPSLGVATRRQRVEEELAQGASAAILSDTWSARDEHTMQRHVDDVTTNELIEEIERPGRAMGMQARGKGQPLYGEGQYGWDPDLRARSTVLPVSYVRRR
jgi:hypothetical protein